MKPLTISAGWKRLIEHAVGYNCFPAIDVENYEEILKKRK